ncbi:hypothetical protein T12_556 [Trichinella patagoniensis]|uniref:Uncharacterized protein n=1 Tax=Trichinella patagoniensis TaxID=990121 RepID=A0A0V0ZLH9_9BILA|nr:hypothetical protein T12_556 [Trichinella patagoniensis]
MHGDVGKHDTREMSKIQSYISAFIIYKFNALNNSCVLTARCEPKRHTLVNSWLLIYLKLEFFINDKFFATSFYTRKRYFAK